MAVYRQSDKTVNYILTDYAHRLNPEVPIERTMRALAELKTQVLSFYV